MKLLNILLIAKVSARDRVIGGFPEPISAHPSTLAIYKNKAQRRHPRLKVRYENKKENLIHCGAVLISSQSAITAAHCLSNTLLSLESGRGSSDHKIREIPPSFQKKHENYSSIYLSNDIAILNFEKKLKYSASTFPAAIPNRMPVNNRPATVCGWGSTRYPTLDYPEEMICADNTILDKSNCIEYYGTQIKPGMVCAKSPTFEQDACIGDSGGPLFDWFSNEIDREGCVHEEVVGLVSWGHGCGTAPGVYTDVFFFKDWIQRNAFECLYCDATPEDLEDDKCIIDI